MEGQGYSSGVQHLAGKCKVLNSSPNTKRIKQKENGRAGDILDVQVKRHVVVIKEFISLEPTAHCIVSPVKDSR